MTETVEELEISDVVEMYFLKGSHTDPTVKHTSAKSVTVLEVPASMST